MLTQAKTAVVNVPMLTQAHLSFIGATVRFECAPRTSWFSQSVCRPCCRAETAGNRTIPDI